MTQSQVLVMKHFLPFISGGQSNTEFNLPNKTRPSTTTAFLTIEKEAALETAPHSLSIAMGC